MLKTLYVTLAIICSVLAMIPFGYAILHGGTRLLVLLPAVFILFMLPFALGRIKNVPPLIRKTAFIIPVLLVTLPLLGFLVIGPYLELSGYKQLLAQTSINSMIVNENTDAVLPLLHLKIEYVLQVPVALHIPENNLDYSPIDFPEVAIRAVEQYIMYQTGITIWRNGVPYEGTIKSFPEGEYRVIVHLMASGTGQRLGDSAYCRSGSTPPFSKIQSEAPTTRPHLEIKSRVDLSNRMGTSYIELYKEPLDLKFNLTDMEKAWLELPLCTAEQ